jgi:predicted polyphosphate/ATP-dependent NAD kinase
MKYLGLIVNPIAGLGGRVGLKGSDGAAIQRQALALGAVAQSLSRATEALERLARLEDLEIITYPGEMGEDAARACGRQPRVIGSTHPGQTTAQDTKNAARDMLRLEVDLLLFAGGDGTARDVFSAVGEDLPALGIPAGVKIHSAVYAVNPPSAGELAALYLQGRVTGLREAEVMDIDEEEFRQGRLSAKLYGYLSVPFRSSLVQNLKMASIGGQASVASIAQDVAGTMEDGCLYIIGPGTTTRAIASELGIDKTLLGVDIVLDRKLLASDVNEAQIIDLLDSRPPDGPLEARIIVTPIGGQGYIFGRGNQQISPTVIERVGRENILVVSTKEKLYAMGSEPLRVDTGDCNVDQLLSGYMTVVTGYRERAVRKVAC